MNKQAWIGLIAITSAVLTDISTSGHQSANAEATTVIKVSAKKFEYDPPEITMKKGVPVILKLTTEDRSHGFNIPSMKVRADIQPGQVTELKVTPQQSGEFDFFCDVYCGNGHEDMSGKIKVVD